MTWLTCVRITSGRRRGCGPGWRPACVVTVTSARRDSRSWWQAHLTLHRLLRFKSIQHWLIPCTCHGNPRTRHLTQLATLHQTSVAFHHGCTVHTCSVQTDDEHKLMAAGATCAPRAKAACPLTSPCPYDHRAPPGCTARGRLGRPLGRARVAAPMLRSLSQDSAHARAAPHPCGSASARRARTMTAAQSLKSGGRALSPGLVKAPALSERAHHGGVRRARRGGLGRGEVVAHKQAARPSAAARISPAPPSKLCA
jgi:hypothetical protein